MNAITIYSMYQDLTFKLLPYSCCHLPYNTKLNLFPSRFSDNTFFFCFLIPNISRHSRKLENFFILLDVQVVVQIFKMLLKWPRSLSIQCQLHKRPKKIRIEISLHKMCFQWLYSLQMLTCTFTRWNVCLLIMKKTVI